jgi:hypothetical protein
LFDDTMLDKAEKFATDGGTLPGHVLAVELDSLAPATASEIEQHERPFIYHAEALARLGAPTPVVDEIERLRAQVASMAAVCEAACEWADRREHGSTPLSRLSPPGKLKIAVDAYRAGQPAQPTTVTAGTLTPAEWEALEAVRDMAAPNQFTAVLSERGDRLLVSAIDKIRAARGSRP